MKIKDFINSTVMKYDSEFVEELRTKLLGNYLKLNFFRWRCNQRDSIRKAG